MLNVESSCILLTLAGTLLALAVNAGPAVDSTDNTVRITNGGIEIVVDTKDGINPRVLRDTSASGPVFADLDYTWPGGKAPALTGKPTISKKKDGTRVVTLKGKLGTLLVEQTFEAPVKTPGAIKERITITNTSDAAIDTAEFRCGFTKRLKNGDTWLPEADATKVCGIPYRRETDGQVQEYALSYLMEHSARYAAWNIPWHPTTTWGSEGWVLSRGERTLLAAKYNPDAMEWALISPAQSGSAVCIGGAGHWKYDLPPAATSLDPGKSLAFGETLYQVVDGNWKSAYYAYRSYMESVKCGLRKGYDPPVQWNELYENEYFGAVGGAFANSKIDDAFWLTDFYKDTEQKLLHELYTLSDMKEQAAKASELGCEALYLDPGWDITGTSHIWAEDRLGTTESFLKTMKDDYNLKVCVWVSLAGVPPTNANPWLYPREARVMDKDGNKTMLLCWPSPTFLKGKIDVLTSLAGKGIAFMLFDSTQYTGPCYDPTHGHSTPSTREEHAKAMLKITQAVHKANPKTLIEWHDPITGPCNLHYTPTYFLYNKPNSFDCIWGHEFMWDSMGDLLSGRALSLYYYNLAYSIPMYLHIGLKSDNANALVFWWYASTIRHLGVGGQHPDPKVWEAHKQAMKTYMSLKPFYTQGAFYGLDETIHIHTLAAKGQSVMNVFNLTDKDEDREIKFTASDIGLPAGSKLSVEGADAQINGERVTLRVHVPAKGHALVRIAKGTSLPGEK